MTKERFEGVFPLITSELINYVTAQGMPKEVIEWYKNVCISISSFDALARAYPT